MTVHEPDDIPTRAPDTQRAMPLLDVLTGVISAARQPSVFDERLAPADSLPEAGGENRAIMAPTSDALFVIDPAQGCIEVNDQACLLTGYTRDELLGTAPGAIALPGEAGRPRQVDAAPIGSLLRGDVTLIRKDGLRLPVETLGTILDDGRVLVIARDISERKRAERELGEARQRAEAASRAKTEFLSRMSHELRTPLNAVLGFAQLLEMEELTADQQESVTYILAAGRHLLALVNEVLDISRIENGQMTFLLEALDVHEVIVQSMGLVQGLARKRGIQLHAPAADGPPRYILADRKRLSQVLLNLFSNAVKYNRHAGTVTTSYHEVDGGRLRIAVTDTGPGISDDEIDRLFTPFDRLSAEVRGIEGVGLGLSLTRLLVESMGGDIGVHSSPEEGTTFWFELPLARPTDG